MKNNRVASKLLFAGLLLLFLLHTDLWFWNDARLILGLPVGLVYHILFCLASSALMACIVLYAWPPGLDAPDGTGKE